MEINSIALEAMARTLLDELAARGQYVSVESATNTVALLLRNPMGIFTARILPDRTLHMQYRVWYDTIEESRSVQYTLRF